MRCLNLTRRSRATRSTRCNLNVESSSSERPGIVAILTAVLGLHLSALNVLYPKFLGSRLQLNPLAVTLSLLFWGWLWGAMGLVLAVPLTAAIKIVFDHIETLRGYGSWLGE